ncbi:cocaine esterase-like [Gadus chalcogrammus]|uniref:cocaine esterase-like n=1 Tax=Gadus chalcogrammus TaxID=1042646 RepID=UPI0024C21853|nr:cocaine esterase-like [Gadus chalcogrammus]
MMGLCVNAVTVALSCVLFYLSACAETQGPVVKATLGALRGRYVGVKGQEADVQAFMGVPFAKPPVGPLRFSAPQPADGWEGVREATKEPNMCLQNKELLEGLMTFLSMKVELPDVSEDCLYLNVFAPSHAAPGTDLPVMVWIHGGGFTSGAATVYEGSALAANQDVVVVVLQYRLGLLGFFSTGDGAVPGNLGLLDQVEALRWVQQNIRAFGGDPGLVTVFGESAGGNSVSLLTISPLSAGLFKHAIAQSGTAALKNLVSDQSPLMTQMVANALGCDASPEKITRCLKNMDTNALLALTKDPTLGFPVTVDGFFLTDKVNKIYRDHQVPPIPFMTGLNSDEGGWLLPSMLCPPNWTEGMDREQTMAILGVFHPELKDKPIRDLMEEEYLGTTEDRNEIRKVFTKLLGDMIFTIPAIITAKAHRDAGAPVYLYQYHHVPQFLKEKRPSFVGADHGDEMILVLGFCFTTQTQLTGACTAEELQLSKLLMSYWGNFARTGSPGGPGLVPWPQYGPQENYLSIDMKQEVRQHLASDVYTFFTKTIPEKLSAAQKKNGQSEHPEL